MAHGLGSLRGIVLAVITAGVMLAGCGTTTTSPQSRGDRGAKLQAEGSQEQARPLRWSQKPLVKPGFYDLCNDEQAIRAGLDGGALAEDRRSLGIDCDESSPGNPRYAYQYADGSAVQVTEGERKTFDPAAAKARQREEVREEVGAPPGSTQPPGAPMGYSGPPYKAPSRDGRLAVMRGSMSLREGVLRGLVRNGRQAFAQHATVIATAPDAGAAGRSTVPFTVQPGEPAPFEIKLSDAASLQSVEIAVTATFRDRPDADRALRLTGAPGHWQGPVTEFPGVPGAVRSLPDSGTVDYFETIVQANVPTSHPDLSDAVGAGIGELMAVGATLDRAGRVVDVRKLPLIAGPDGSRAKSLSTGEQALVGVLLQGDAAKVRIWASGR